MFRRKRFKINKAKITIHNCSSVAPVTLLYENEIDGSIYFTIEKPLKVPFGQDNKVEWSTCKLSKEEDGNFGIEVLPNFDNIPLHVLRRMKTYFTDGNWPLETSNSNFWNFQGRRDFEDVKMPVVSLSFFGRSEVCDSTSCEMETITYREVRKFVYSLDFLPPPVLNFAYTYIPKGEFWVLYSGNIRNTKPYENAFNQLKNSVKLSDMPKDKMWEILDNCNYLSDAVWKYHLVQDKWELLLPSTKGLGVVNMHSPSRPRGKLLMTLHHVERKKIYYACRDNITSTIDCLFEYDYQLDHFNRIDWNYTITNDQCVIGSTIDFSNDTLLLMIFQRHYTNPKILVFCFQTHQIIHVKLTSKWYEESASVRIRLLDNFDRLVFVPESIMKRSSIFYVDWGKVKRTFLNPLLEKYRKNLSK